MHRPAVRRHDLLAEEEWRHDTHRDIGTLPVADQDDIAGAVDRGLCQHDPLVCAQPLAVQHGRDTGIPNRQPCLPIFLPDLQVPERPGEAIPHAAHGPRRRDRNHQQNHRHQAQRGRTMLADRCPHPAKTGDGHGDRSREVGGAREGEHQRVAAQKADDQQQTHAQPARMQARQAQRHGQR